MNPHDDDEREVGGENGDDGVRPDTDDAPPVGAGRNLLIGAGIAGIAAGVLVFLLVGGVSEGQASAGAGLTPPMDTARSTTATPEASKRPGTATDTETPATHADEGATLEGVDAVVAPAREDAALLVEMLREAHGRFHASDDQEAIAEALKAAYRHAFGKQTAWIAAAKSFHNTYGLGRFVRRGRGTPLAGAVMALVRALPTHGLGAQGHDPKGLESAMGDSPTVAGGEPGAAAAGPVRALATFVAGLLEAPEFDEVGVRERLEEAPAGLDTATLAEAVRHVVTRRAEGALATDAVGDTTFLKALMMLALDFRFVKAAGPHHLRTRDTAVERDAKALRQLLGVIVDAETPDAGLAELLPIHPQYEAMRGILARYKGFLDAGGCEELPKGWRFRVGSKGKEVKRLQARLRCEGYYDGPDDGLLEGSTAEALMQYQREHDLEAEGVVGEETIKSMNVPLARRIAQIELSLQRMRESHRDRMTSNFIRVNLPAFMLTFYEDYKPIRQQRVIVGTNRLDDDKVKLIQGHINRTKLFGTNLYEVIVNPTWILPKRVEEGELKTSLEKDPEYLDKQNIKKVRLSSGTEVFIQGSGDGNVLGKVKFLLEESNAIYLHDTDKRHLFKKRRRDFSHGCMRVHEAIDFAKWLLLRAGYEENDIARSFRHETLQRGFKLKEPIPLVTEYMTVDLLDDTHPIFYADIYGYDDAAIDGRLPVKETERWGAPLLRPRWVPLVEKSVVDGWRAAGKPAPRDYKPEGAHSGD
jgi:murein L,D-transpeptidase YcbB/YkuD